MKTELDNLLPGSDMNVERIFVRFNSLNSQAVYVWIDPEAYSVHDRTLAEKLVEALLGGRSVNVRPLYLIDDFWNSSGSKLFIFYVADCFDPPLYLVQSDSFEDAYEQFIDHAAIHLGLAIEDSELHEYSNNPATKTNYTREEWDALTITEKLDSLEIFYSSNGVPVDTESVQGEEASLLMLTFKAN